MILRDPDLSRAARIAQIAPLVAFALFPVGVLAAGTETTSLWPWAVFLTLGFSAVASDLVHILRDRIPDAPPYRHIRKTLSIETKPWTGGPRDAVPPPIVLIDGRSVDLGEAPRVAITRSGSRYHVSLALGREIVRMDTLPDHATAMALAEEVCAALRLPPPSEEMPVEELRDLWITMAFVALIALGSVVGATYWGVTADLPDRVGPPLLVAALASGAGLVIARRLGLRSIRIEAGSAAHRAFGIPEPDSAPWNWRGGCLGIGALAGIAIAIAFAAGQVAAPDLPAPARICWFPDTPIGCGIDMNGDGTPEAIEFTCSGSGPSASVSLSALDVKTGVEVTAFDGIHSSNLVTCEPPFLALGAKDKKTDIVAHAALGTEETIWRLTVPGKVREILRSRGCGLVRGEVPGGEEVWSSFSLATGDPCAAIPEPVSPAAIETARHTLESRQPTSGRRTVDGITYALAAAGPSSKVALSASRGETLLWNAELPVRPLEGQPLAVAGGTVVVASTDARWGKYLRIVGVDVTTGSVRYVHRHPRNPKNRVDLVAVGAMILIGAGRLASVEPSSGRVAWITKE